MDRGCIHHEGTKGTKLFWGTETIQHGANNNLLLLLFFVLLGVLRAFVVNRHRSWID
jgi:hypothetical protein